MKHEDVTVPGSENLAKPFEESRSHLRAVAFRMLGSLGEADDAVQEAWLRLSRSDVSEVENLKGWLTTVVARVCLDMLRSRKARAEELLGEQAQAAAAPHVSGTDPEKEAELADSVGLALLVVLEVLEPAERLAFVLHDMFAVPFEEIANIVGRTPDATRQLASRARRRVQGSPRVSDVDLSGQRSVVAAFLTALRGGDFDALIAVLDPDVVVRTDMVPPGAPKETRGAHAWAKGAVAYGHMAAHVQMALIDGTPGLVFAPKGHLVRAIRFAISGGVVSELEIISDKAALAELEIAVLGE